jgi:hypothetical protein
MELDIQGVCDGIHRLAKHLNLNMDLTPSTLYTLILQYMGLRHTVVHPFEITSSWRRRISIPAGWTAHHEQIWVQWLEYKVPLDVWNTLVIEPVFRSDERLWEIGVEGWRDEIYTFMPFWFARSISRFEEIDPTTLPDEEEEVSSNEEKKKTYGDPYVEDYYDRR